MKTILFGAAALLFSTSALAATPQAKGMSRPASPTVTSKHVDRLGANGAMIGNAITIDWPAKAIETGRAFDTKRMAEASKAMGEAAEAETPSTTAQSDLGDAPTSQGMGGPLEPVDASGTVTAAAAATSYRACAPGPGDDNCIQLYEPGVRAELASWQSSHDGTQVAMGGPEEPIDAAADGQDATLAAYEPLPEDLVLPASTDLAKTDLPTEGPDVPTAI